MTNPFIGRLHQTRRSDAHEHSPTPNDIQRWEDDGGAVRPDPPLRHPERHRHGKEAELAAA